MKVPLALNRSLDDSLMRQYLQNARDTRDTTFKNPEESVSHSRLSLVDTINDQSMLQKLCDQS